MQTNFRTERLQLEPLAEKHVSFIKELVNTAGWLKFIGDRNVHNDEDALAYINKIKNMSTVTYWVASTIENDLPIGIITCIKRDYLTHKDIGFAFLPMYAGKGFAYEAAKEILNCLTAITDDKKMQACTIPSNTNSIKLLEKMGFIFQEQIEHDGELLSIYFFCKE